MTVDEACKVIGQLKVIDPKSELKIDIKITVVRTAGYVTVSDSKKLAERQLFQTCVANEYGLSVEDVLSVNKHDNRIFARAVLFHLLKNESSFDYTFKELGRIYNKDHATIMNAVKKTYPNSYETSKIFKAKADNILNQIKGN
jgi:chromosomal replication initiation ATPase DnaA